MAKQVCSGISRRDFPSDFLFGASTSALQTESGPTDGGRGPSTWDSFLGDQPASDSLHKYRQDVRCLAFMNMDVYRFSIAWPRLFPKGKVTEEGLNQEGLTFYKNLIAELKKNDIVPFVTLFHFDMPVALKKAYNGVLGGSEFVEDFNAYADFCFKNFGDDVKNWITFNEPSLWCTGGYRQEMPFPDERTKFPYMAAHNVIIAHATAVQTYREKYKAQGGRIGITLATQWFLPLTQTPTDIEAAERAWDFYNGWFVDPLTTGDYPFSMKVIVRERLPEFTETEKILVKGAFDFIGINYYISTYAQGLPFSVTDVSTGYEFDTYVTLTNVNTDGTYPPGIADILRHFKNTYNNPLIFITENGCKDTSEIFIDGIVQDDERIEFIKNHLTYVVEALNDGCNLKVYCVWTLIDGMEMLYYYSVRMGLNYVDYPNDFKRTPKKSAQWLRSFLASEQT